MIAKDELFYALFNAHASRALDRLVERLSHLDDTEELTARHTAMLWGDLEPEERTWYLVSTEFTLYAIRNPHAARTLADHDAKVRTEIVSVLTMLARDLYCPRDIAPDKRF